MELISITAKNFQSFQELEYTFLSGEPVLILGENKSDTGQESNGSGKSVMVSVIEMCLLHTTSKKANDKELVMWGETQSNVSLTIHCPIRKETMLIERIISVKNGGQSQLSINGIIKYAFEDNMVREIDKSIIDWIGISAEDLQNFFILSKFKYKSFFDASNTQLVQLIGRFSNSSIIDGIDKDIIKETEEKEKVLLKKNDEKNEIFGMIKVHEENLNIELTTDKKELVENEIRRIDYLIIDEGEKIGNFDKKVLDNITLITTYEDKLLDQLSSLQKANLEIQKLNKDTTDFETRFKAVDDKVVQTKEEKEKYELKKSTLSKDYSEVSQILTEIDLNIRGSVTCPKCQHQFIVGKEDIDIEEEKVAHKQTSAILEELNKSLAEVKVTIEAFDPTLRNLRRDRVVIETEENELRTQKRNIQNSIINLEREKGSLENNIQLCKDKNETTKSYIKDCKAKIEELELSKVTVTVDKFDNKARIASIKENIISCNNKIKQIETESSIINDEIFEIKKWSFTFKEFIQFLSAKTLKILEGYANKFLFDIHSDLRVELSGYKIKSDGTLSDKITATVIRDGEAHSIGTFSGGEHDRLEAAMIDCVSHAINSTHKYGGLSFLSLDEIFNSSDGLGIKLLTDSYLELKKNVLITTHVPHNQYGCQVLKVTKENRVSSIQYIN